MLQRLQAPRLVAHPAGVTQGLLTERAPSPLRRFRRSTVDASPHHLACILGALRREARQLPDPIAPLSLSMHGAIRAGAPATLYELTPGQGLSAPPICEQVLLRSVESVYLLPLKFLDIDKLLLLLEVGQGEGPGEAVLVGVLPLGAIEILVILRSRAHQELVGWIIIFVELEHLHVLQLALEVQVIQSVIQPVILLEILLVVLVLSTGVGVGPVGWCIERGGVKKTIAAQTLKVLLLFIKKVL